MAKGKLQTAILFFIWFLVSGFWFLITDNCCGDTIYLEDGSVMKGVVVEECWDRVAFNTPEGEKIIFRKDIDEIFFDELEQNYYEVANRFLCDRDFERAEKFYTKVLQLNSDYKAAQDGLSRLNDRRMKEVKRWKAVDPRHTLKEQIGISVLKEGEHCRVSEIFGESTNLNIGDAISAVWDESTKFMEEGEVVERIIGIPDTLVKITIQRKIRFCSAGVPWYLRIFGIRKEDVLPLRMSREGLMVGKVMKGSLAGEADLKYGDRIITIDQNLTRYMPLKKANTLIHGETLKEVELTIERDITLVRKR